jgi:hypothetical protein
MSYDIFISYRRKGAGAGVAGELQAKLENLGHKVFLDVDEIGSGQFPVQIENAIDDCKDFLLVLSPGTLDCCIDEEDWVRREIVQAQNAKKNIIGVGLPGFIMPKAEALPEPLKPLTTIQVFLWTHEYRTASFERIVENLVSSELKKRRNRRGRLAMLSLVLVLLSVVLFFSLKDSTAVPDEIEPTDTEVIADNHNETQLFDYHMNKAEALVLDLPDGIEFKKDFLQMVSNKDIYLKMMEGLAEYDSAMILKNSFGDTFEDAYNVEAKRNALLELRKAYMETITSDLKLMIAEGGLKFAQQDMEIAYILALPEDKPILDSLNAIIKSK